MAERIIKILDRTTRPSGKQPGTPGRGFPDSGSEAPLLSFPGRTGKTSAELHSLLRSLQGRQHVLYRNLDFVQRVVDCARQHPPIECYDAPFDPAHIPTIRVDGRDYPNPQWLLAAWTHVDQQNREIMRGRVNEQTGKSFPSIEELRKALEQCVVFVDILDSEQIALRSLDPTEGVKVCAIPDMRKPENAGLVRELEALVPR